MGQIRAIFQPLIAKFSKLVPHQLEQQSPSLLFGLCAFTMVCCVFLGGGTRNGFLSDAILQFLSIPLFLAALWKLLDLRANGEFKSAQLKFALAFCLAIVLLPLAQLIPLPSWIWTALPGRKPVEAVFDLLGGAKPWMPVSVVPYQTWASALSLLPAFAIFIGTVLLSYRERRLLTLVLLGIGVVSVLLGLVQVAQGPGSSLRFFLVTNTNDAVGSFANRNHFAAFVYSLILFAGAWAIYAVSESENLLSRRGQTGASILPIVVSFLILIMLLSAEAVARSRTGLILTMFAVFGIFALAYTQRSGSRKWTTRLMLAATTLAAVFVVQFSLYRIMDRFADDPLTDARLPVARTTLQASKAFMPFGSGIGSFIPVYGIYQKPVDLLTNAYMNHAHNDFLELSLETGAAGALLVGVFMVWFVLRSIANWRRAPSGANAIDRSLARAATMIIALLLVHSLLDYPLRTVAMMAVLAFSCSLLIVPVQAAESGVLREAVEPRSRGHRPARMSVVASQPPAPVQGAAVNTPVPAKTADNRWGEDVDWPEVWRKPENPRRED
jgi:O-antigen ligase